MLKNSKRYVEMIYLIISKNNQLTKLNKELYDLFGCFFPDIPLCQEDIMKLLIEILDDHFKRVYGLNNVVHTIIHGERKVRHKDVSYDLSTKDGLITFLTVWTKGTENANN